MRWTVRTRSTSWSSLVPTSTRAGTWTGANLAEERAKRNGWMLCELVFMSYANLDDRNLVRLTGAPADPVEITMNPVAPSPHDVAESDRLAADLFAALGAPARAR
jgi:hypothetical protein